VSKFNLSKTYSAVKVPEITLMFWVIKLWSTGMGESTSDFFGDHSLVIAGIIGLGGTILAFYLQLRQERYKALYYWLMVGMIAISGTMVADVIHDALNISYVITTIAFGAITAALFYLWYRSEGTLSIHTITTRKREVFYWFTVFFSFTLGTAAGDLTAQTLNLGFLGSIFLFSAVMLVPLLLWRVGVNPIFTFWFAYVDTRPIGASFSDYFSKPHSITGLDFGDNHTALVGWIVFLILIASVTYTKHGVQSKEDKDETFSKGLETEAE
jgi:uncharacterized membrane-anchored protein